MSKTKKNTNPHYELLYIVSNKYTEDELAKININVKNLLEKHEAKITYSEPWGKKKLMYPIKHFAHGYYELIEFDATNEAVNKINHELRISNEILRHMLVKAVVRTAEEIQAEKKKEQAKIIKKEEEKKVEASAEEKPKAKKAVDLKDLDEKLDKILETDDLL
jgi:small subunit ribosomal protein S6